MRLLFAGARLRQAALGDADPRVGLGHLRSGRIGGRLLGLGSGDSRLELLLGNFVLGREPAQSLHVARCFRRVRVRLALTGLEGDEPRPPRAVVTLLDAVVVVIGTALSAASADASASASSARALSTATW